MIAAILFTAYLIYDLQLLMGGRKYQISPDEYIFAAVSIYLDIVQVRSPLLATCVEGSTYRDLSVLRTVQDVAGARSALWCMELVFAADWHAMMLASTRCSAPADLPEPATNRRVPERVKRLWLVTRGSGRVRLGHVLFWAQA